MDPNFKKMNIFRDRLRMALNFFDIFNEGFEPLSLESPLELSKCFLPLISLPKNLIQRSNVSLSRIKNLMEIDCFGGSKYRITNNIMKKYFVKCSEKPIKPSAKRQKKTILRYSYEFLRDVSNLYDLAFLENSSLENFDLDIHYKAFGEEELHDHMDQLYLIAQKPPESNTREDREFLFAFFSDNFLLNFTISLAFLLANLMFFLLGFNDSILKKVYLSIREDPELSILELISCKEFNTLKDFANEFLQNKDSVYYTAEIFGKYYRDFLSVARNVYYQEEYARILRFSNAIGYEKINIVLEELDAGHMASILKKLEEILHAAFDFMDFSNPKLNEYFVYCLYEMLNFNFNFNYQEPTKKHWELMHLVERNYLNLFEFAIRDCEALLKNAVNNNRVISKDETKISVAKKLKIYFIILQNSTFTEFHEKSLDLIYEITTILYSSEYKLPYAKTFIELCQKSKCLQK